MKSTPIISRRITSGFTLIELLVVVGIIAVLASLAMPAMTGALRSAKKTRTQSALKDIVLGIKNYQVEYNRYPVTGNDKAETPRLTDSSNDLIDVLLGGNPNKLNPRKQAFMEPPLASKNGVGGLTGAEGSYSLTDTWGNPFNVIMDLNYDNRIANPDRNNDDSSVSANAPQDIPVGVIAYSLGEDKKDNTKDDVVSWR
jgi:prepilin-type N-terminal cleavage/methylation domain-containing protein